MKKLTLLFISILFFLPTTYASHVIGGEVSWECQGNGQYVFLMTIYKDCTGAPWTYENSALEIFGNPLPTSATNKTISSIILSPDSAKWIQNDKGSLSPVCADSNARLSCNNSDFGVVRAYYYRSAPITLNGTPPASGWMFAYTAPCCRPILSNTADGATPIFKSTLYANTNRNGNGCMLNTPKFVAHPIAVYCKRTHQQTYNYHGTAMGADSLTYDWGQPIDAPAYKSDTLLYKTGYSFTSPLPDTSFNKKNQPAHLNVENGLLDFSVFNGGPYIDRYAVVVKVDAWKNGKIYASVNREFPVIMVDCSVLNNNKQNNAPLFTFNAKQKDFYEDTVKVGTKVTFPVIMEDIDSTLSGNSLQKVRLKTYDAEALATDRMDTTACLNQPCAVFKNTAPQFDSTSNAYIWEDTSVISTDFEWQTEYQHLDSNGKAKTYYFPIYGQDEFCPIPAAIGSYIKITVEPLIVHKIMVQNNTLIAMDILNNYQWYDGIADSILPGETMQQFTPSYNSSYGFISTLGSYADTSDLFAFTMTSLADNNFAEQLQLFPNPTNQNVRISFGNRIESVTVKVRNIQGQLIQEENYPSTSLINLKLKGDAGIYFLEIRNEAGETANLKVMKKK